MQQKRRVFLKTAGAASAVAFPQLHLGAADEVPPTKLNVGLIGAGGRGGANTGGVMSENITAVCDVNGQTLDKVKRRFERFGAKHYTDWRDLLKQDGLDAVVVSTADHHHAPISLAAMKRGLHVYCEKPLAHNVREARKMRDVYAAERKKHGIATQMGTQIHAGDNFRRVVELVQAGAIGSVTEAHVWCSRTINPIGPAVLPTEEVPDWFDWNSWLGPANDRPYNTGYWRGGNLNWNRRWDFGNGVLGDMGSHLIDLPWWALKLHTPLTCEAEGPKADHVACPPWMKVTWEHGPRKDAGEALNAPLKLVWYHGGRDPKHRPTIKTGVDLTKWFNGILFVGEKGMLLADYGKRLLLPAEKFKGYKAPEPWIKPSLGHHKEWLHAAKAGGESLCNFEYSGSLIEHNLLGCAAYRTGKKLEWDAKNLRCPNAPEADEFLGREYRKGWEI